MSLLRVFVIRLTQDAICFRLLILSRGAYLQGLLCTQKIVCGILSLSIQTSTTFTDPVFLLLLFCLFIIIIIYLLDSNRRYRQ